MTAQVQMFFIFFICYLLLLSSSLFGSFVAVFFKCSWFATVHEICEIIFNNFEGFFLKIFKMGIFVILGSIGFYFKNAKKIDFSSKILKLS
jgi:hypothetical protein